MAHARDGIVNVATCGTHDANSDLQSCSGITSDVHRLVPHTFPPRNCKALPTTDSELKLIAAAAMIGLSKSPNAGYSTPAVDRR
jgi:hypothetical protein